MKLYCSKCINLNENKTQFIWSTIFFKWKCKKMQEVNTLRFKRQVKEEQFYGNVQCVIINNWDLPKTQKHACSWSEKVFVTKNDKILYHENIKWKTSTMKILLEYFVKKNYKNQINWICSWKSNKEEKGISYMFSGKVITIRFNSWFDKTVMQVFMFADRILSVWKYLFCFLYVSELDFSICLIFLNYENSVWRLLLFLCTPIFIRAIFIRMSNFEI